MIDMAVEKGLALPAWSKCRPYPDNGAVIDAWVRVSLVGIELLANASRVVIASVETFHLKHAEVIGLTGRLQRNRGDVEVTAETWRKREFLTGCPLTSLLSKAWFASNSFH